MINNKILRDTFTGSWWLTLQNCLSNFALQLVSQAEAEISDDIAMTSSGLFYPNDGAQKTSSSCFPTGLIV